MNEQRRRSQRRHPEQVVHVTDAMTGAAIGRIGNLSIDGLMLIANAPMRENALYQFAFSLPDETGRPKPLEVGVHEQWGEAAPGSGQYWAGFRIIDISSQDYELLDNWIRAGGHG